MAPEWLIVLNMDGAVLAADGGAPPDWVGTRLAGQPGVPEALLRAQADAQTKLRESMPPVSTATEMVTIAELRIRLVVVHAVPVPFVATNLRWLLESAIRVMEPQARAMEVALTLDASGGLPELVHVDPEKIGWALTALVGNALRYVRRGTRLRPGGTIQIRARASARDVIVEVQDDGSGIPTDQVPALMRRPAGGGLAPGLALILVREIVAAHGGTLELESSTDAAHSGTTVRLTLPGH